jgi:hypothetical protein
MRSYAQRTEPHEENSVEHWGGINRTLYGSLFFLSCFLKRLAARFQYREREDWDSWEVDSESEGSNLATLCQSLMIHVTPETRFASLGDFP